MSFDNASFGNIDIISPNAMCFETERRKDTQSLIHWESHEPNWPAANSPRKSFTSQGARPSDSSIRHYGIGCRSG